MTQVMSAYSFFISIYLPFYILQLNSKLDELNRLIESDYESTKSINLFQYFDKIYTLCYGTSNFQTLIDTLIQKKYASRCPILTLL